MKINVSGFTQTKHAGNRVKLKTKRFTFTQKNNLRIDYKEIKVVLEIVTEQSNINNLHVIQQPKENVIHLGYHFHWLNKFLLTIGILL